MPEKNLITLSNGIVLRMKPMPPLLLNAIANGIPEPDVPMLFVEEDNRHEANPNDPNYQKALNDRLTNISLRIIDATLSVGTELISVPDDLVKPEDDSWLNRAKLAGHAFDKESQEERYLAWLRFYAVETQADLNKINTIPLQLAGLQEAEVEEVINTFRGGEIRGDDNGVSGEGIGTNGHNVPVPATRTRTRNRRT